LWNAEKRPPASNTDGQNNTRLLKTRSGHTITLDDTKGSEKIVIGDQSGSSITMMNDGSITINAKASLTISSQNDSITLQAAKGNIILAAKEVDVQ
jgi:uncharacterized protein involved in type VI secretion and phage assembly